MALETIATMNIIRDICFLQIIGIIFCLHPIQMEDGKTFWELQKSITR